LNGRGQHRRRPNGNAELSSEKKPRGSTVDGSGNLDRKINTDNDGSRDRFALEFFFVSTLALSLVE
jgi:hypothetical protein